MSQAAVDLTQLVYGLTRDLELLCKFGSQIARSRQETGLGKLRRLLNSARLALEGDEGPQQEAIRHKSLQAARKVGADLGIFKTLADRKEANFTTDALRILAAPGAESTLFRRVLAFCAGHHLLDQVRSGYWQANISTEALAKAGTGENYRYAAECLDPAWLKLPKVLRDNDYQLSAMSAELPFRAAHELSHHHWLRAHPDVLADYARFVDSENERHPSWIGSPDESEIFDFAELLTYSKKEICHKTVNSNVSTKKHRRMLFVDVATTFGRECTQLVTSHPCMADRVMLQDSRHMLTATAGRLPGGTRDPALQGIKPYPVDIFDSQPERGARIYHLRNVLRQHADNQCHLILSHIVDAMVSDSLLIIDEMIMPDDGVSDCPAKLVSVDFTMMLFGGAVRTKQQISKLLASAELEIVAVKRYGVKEFNAHAIFVRKARIENEEEEEAEGDSVQFIPGLGDVTSTTCSR